MTFNIFAPLSGGTFTQAIEGGKLPGAVLATLGERNDKGYLLALGCADEWIAESGGKCSMQREHSAVHIIGEWSGIAQSGNELRAGAGELFTDIQTAQETAALINRGILEGVSVGFNADPEDVTIVELRDPKTGRWTFGADFAKIQIVEASIVLNPGDKTARIQAMEQAVGSLRDLKQARSTRTQGKDMPDKTVIELVNDAVDKRVEQAETTILGKLDVKFSELDTGIENQVTQALDKARTATPGRKDAWEQFQKNGGAAYKCNLTVDPRYTLGENYASPTTGGGTSTGVPLPNYVEMNFLRPYVMVMPVGAAAVAVPKLDAISFAAKGNIGSGAAETGGMSSTTANIATHTAKVTMPTEMDMDIPEFRSAVAGQFMRAWQTYQLGQMLALPKALNAASGRRVNTGVAADLPAANAVEPKFYDLIDHVGQQYNVEGETLLVTSGYARQKLAGDLDGGFAWDETRKLSIFDGHPLKITSSTVDRGNSAGHVSAIFGNWNAGMTLYERMTLDIMVFMETDPGYITFYAEGRFVPVMQFNGAFSILRTAA